MSKLPTTENTEMFTMRIYPKLKGKQNISTKRHPTYNSRSKYYGRKLLKDIRIYFGKQPDQFITKKSALNTLEYSCL